MPSPAAMASSGTISPASVRASAAANWNVPDRALGLDAGGLDRLGRLGGDDARRSAPPARRAADAARSSTSARFQRGSGPARQGRRRRRATARSTSAAVHVGTAPTRRPSYGDRTTIGSLAPSPVKRSPASGRAWMLGVVMARTILPSWQTPAARRRTRTSTGTGRSPSPTAAAPATPRRTPMPAFRAAVELGYRYLETDVHVTADGVLVAFHDDDLQRTCGSPGRISELPWSKVATARRRRNGPDPDGSTSCSMPAPTPAGTSTARPPAPSAPLARAVSEHRALDRVCVASFSDRRIRALRRALGSSAVHQPRPVGARACCGRSACASGTGSPPRCRRRRGRFKVVTPALRAPRPPARHRRCTCGRSTMRPR